MDPASSTPKREPSSNWPNQPSASPQGGFSYKGQPIVEEALQNTNGPALPGVLGQRAGAARQALNRYRVREEQTTAMPELVGQVLNQWPYAGSNLAPGEEVTIVVGVARAPSRMHRGVPQVQSRPWRDAVQMVERSGFQVRLTAMESTDRQRGLIVMQTPLPGSLLESGGTMRLRIGAGSGPYSPGAASGTDRPSSQPVDPRPVDPVPADPRPAERSGGVDTPPAGSANSPIDDGPPAGAGPAPIDTPPSGGRTERPIETPPTRKPASEDPGQDPAPAGGRSFSAPALSTPPAGESYPYKYGADFTWTAVAGASGYEVELQEELPSGAWRSLQTFKVKEARLRPERFERGRYRWRVRGTNGAAKGRWSTYRRLYMY